MKESKFTIILEKYMRTKKLYGQHEIKQTDKTSILFAEVKNHQITSLLAAQEVGFLHKISDADPRRKGFDVIFSRPEASYVVIKFPKIACIIPVNNFIFERDRSKRKSLTVERAKEISTYLLASR